MKKDYEMRLQEVGESSLRGVGTRRSYVALDLDMVQAIMGFLLSMQRLLIRNETG